MKKLLTSALIFSAMFATGQRRLVMDETTIQTKSDRYELICENKQLCDSIIKNVPYFKKRIINENADTDKTFCGVFYITLNHTALLNRFFDRMNKK